MSDGVANRPPSTGQNTLPPRKGPMHKNEPPTASEVGGYVALIQPGCGGYISITTDGDVTGGLNLVLSEPGNSLGTILTAADARQLEDTLRGIRKWAKARGKASR